MRLGILADIHEDVRSLRPALDVFRRERIERIVVLGDVCETGEEIRETVRLLDDAGAVGVWGNHDFGLCHDPDESVREKYAGQVLRFMTGLRPRLEIDGCLFTHVEPWLDPTRLEDLWYFDGPPDTPEKTARSFDAVPNRIMFVGHFHRWLLANRMGCTSWDGTTPVCLPRSDRFLVAIAAVCDGRCAIFDAEINQLTPFDLRPILPGRGRGCRYAD